MPDTSYLSPTSDPTNPTVHVTVVLPTIPPADLAQLQGFFEDPSWNLVDEEAALVASGLSQPSVCGADCHVSQDGGTLLVDIPTLRLGPVLVWLAHRELTTLVTPKHRIIPRSLYASAIV